MNKVLNCGACSFVTILNFVKNCWQILLIWLQLQQQRPEKSWPCGYSSDCGPFSGCELELVICTDDFEVWMWSQILSYRNCRDAVNFPAQFFEVRNGIFLVKKLQWNEFLVTMPLCCCLFFFFVNDAVIIKTPSSR